MTRRAPLALNTALFLIAACFAIVWPSSAQAGKGVSETFGHPGTDAGGFEWPGGIAVNQTSGDLYAVDAFGEAGGGNRIEQFAADGTFIRAWGWGVATGAAAFEVCSASCQAGIEGSGDGQMSLPFNNSASDAQVAVDQADGSVYVADTYNDRVQKFSASGAFIGAFGTTGAGDGEFVSPQGVAVDPVSGDVYVGDTTSADGATTSNRVQRFNSAGAFQSQVGSGSGSGEGQFIDPVRLGVDSVGRLYVLDRGNARVQRFTAGGTFDQIFGADAVSAPSDVAVDSADDHVYIPGTDPNTLDAGVLEFDPTGARVDIHAANSGVLLDLLGGVAINSTTGRIYISEQVPRRVLILDDVVPPAVSIDPVGGVSAHGATFTGSVNPEGPPDVSYRFEYSVNGTSWTSVPIPDSPVGAGSLPVTVSQTVTRLDPNTEYRVRLVATRAFNAASATSSEVTFRTDEAQPLVRPVGVGSRTDTAAWLGGEVNPQSSLTRYYVEYTEAGNAGFTNSLRTPIAPDELEVGDSNVYVPVVQLVTGLKADTTYRFRVVATNTAGTTKGPATTFDTRKALPAPPVGRGYEMVSPLDKNGAEISRAVSAGTYSTSGAAASGNAVAYAAQGQFAGIGSGPPQAQYRSIRDEQSGWSTLGISPPIEQTPASEATAPILWHVSEGGFRAVVGTNSLLLPGASALGGSFGLYLQDNLGPASSYRLLSVPTVPLTTDTEVNLASIRFIFSSASRDMRHVVFDVIDRKLTPDGPEVGNGVYLWSDGQVRFVSKLPSGEPAGGAVAGFRNNVQGTDNYPGDHVVSDDGQRVFFMDEASRSLYVRESGTATRTVAASERAGDDPSVPRIAEFWAAEASRGAKALFTSPERLTDNATAASGACDFGLPITECHRDLYLWDAGAAPGERLTDLTTADADGAGVLGVAAVADDLSRAYFVATGILAPGGEKGRPNLYLWSADGGLRHVAVLDEQDAAIWSRQRENDAARFRDARLSSDGSRLLFASRANATVTDTHGQRQVYLFDAGSDRLDCVSCGDGPVAGSAWLFFPADVPNQGARAPNPLPRNLSADGRRAFFETRQALVDADTNGKSDVYMWSDGELSLISSGRGFDGAQFIDASASGDDVFFITRDRLVGADTDGLPDVYDARVGGGFPGSLPPRPCAGDECQGLPSSRPVLPNPSSGTVVGELVGPKRGALRVVGLSAAARRSLAQGRAVSLAVHVNKPGRVTVRGVARIGRRGRFVLAAAKRARTQGTVRLKLRLSKPGRRQLARVGRLRVALSVRLSGVRDAQRLSLSLVRAGGDEGDR